MTTDVGGGVGGGARTDDAEVVYGGSTGGTTGTGGANGEVIWIVYPFALGHASARHDFLTQFLPDLDAKRGRTQGPPSLRSAQQFDLLSNSSARITRIMAVHDLR